MRVHSPKNSARQSRCEDQSTIINLTIDNEFIDVLNTMEKRSLNKSSVPNSDKSLNATNLQNYYSPISVAQ